MQISKRTPRTDMYQDAIHDRMASFHEQVAESEGVPIGVLDTYLVRFARLSARVVFEDGEIDFAQATPRDTDSQIAKKFQVFLDSECGDIIAQAEQKVRDQDRPTNPLAGEGDANFTSAAISGETQPAPGSEKKPPA